MNKDKLSNDRRAAAGLSLAWPADCLINITFSEFLIKINGAYVSPTWDFVTSESECHHSMPPMSIELSPLSPVTG